MRLLGVDRSGCELARVTTGHTFDGPTDEASIWAIKPWHANAVPVSLNEDCWLGINGPGVPGPVYRLAVEQYVSIRHVALTIF